MPTSRRSFLSLLAALPLATVLKDVIADALPHLSPTDPTAQSLGYVEDAAKIDPAKESGYKKGSVCSGCQLYQAAQAAGGYAPCAAFPGKVVKANGWCRAFAAKA